MLVAECEQQHLTWYYCTAVLQKRKSMRLDLDDEDDEIECIQGDKIKVVVTGVDDAVNLVIADYISKFYSSCTLMAEDMDDEANETYTNLADMVEKRMSRKKQQIIDAAVQTARDMMTAETQTASRMFVHSLPISNMREFLPPLKKKFVEPAVGVATLLKAVTSGGSGSSLGGAVGVAKGGAAAAAAGVSDSLGCAAAVSVSDDGTDDGTEHDGSQNDESKHDESKDDDNAMQE